MAIEQEVKFSLAPAQIAPLTRYLQHHFGPGESLPLANRYFDTADQRLASAKMALRVRQHGSTYVQTYKRPQAAIQGVQQRQEFEWPLDSNEVQLAPLLTLPDWPNDWRNLVLVEQFSTNFNRHRWWVTVADSRLELALDQGQIAAAGQTANIVELEIELLQGQPQDLLTFVEQLQEGWPLMLYDISKAERAVALLQGRDPWQSLLNERRWPMAAVRAFMAWQQGDDAQGREFCQGLLTWQLNAVDLSATSAQALSPLILAAEAYLAGQQAAAERLQQGFPGWFWQLRQQDGAR